MNKVYCANCKVFILNPLNQADEKFLNFHYGQKGCCDPSLIYKKKDSVMVTFPPGSYFGMFDSPGDIPIFADDNIHRFNSDSSSSDEDQEDARRRR